MRQSFCVGPRREPPPSSVLGVVYKPVGVFCSHDESEAPLIVDCFPEKWSLAGAQWAGRLDRMTSGLLVCATDGQLLHRLIHPKRKVVKRYRVTYTGRLSDDAVAKVADGLKLEDDDKPCRPARLTLAMRAVSRLWKIIEGRFHQVRRMIATLGGQVTELHRDRIGGFDLPVDLIPGESCDISEDDEAL